MSVFIIAEAGINHNGSIDLAYRLVDKAKEANADCIKFQTFLSSNLASILTQKASYQKIGINKEESQLSMLKKLELSFDDFLKLSSYCHKKGIQFLSTPFDLDSIHFLNTLDMPFWKIPSGEITNLPYLIKIAQTHKPVIMSTGMAELEEIRAAVIILKKYECGAVTLLQCHTDYPTAYRNINLLAMQTLRKEFDLPVGLSDHSQGIEVPIAAVALGAAVIEKHFTLSRSLPGPDHKASIEPNELTQMVTAIRHVELAMGDGVKVCSDVERENIPVTRKSIVAKKNIERGEILTEENITTMRPGNGISPMNWFEILGTKAIRNFVKDELIEI